jgi:hypothetical protein
LSAKNGGPENAPFETGPIARHQPDAPAQTRV